MLQTKRPRMVPADKATVWRLWHKGESMSAISRAIDRTPASVFGYLRQFGGIEPRERVRRPDALTLEEREDISRGLAHGESMRSIARSIGRNVSTVSREVGRNGGVTRYRAISADKAAWNAARRPKATLFEQNRKLRRFVSEHLEKCWSPQQVSGWLATEHCGDKGMQVSHETIYKSLYIQSRGTLKKALQQHLRTHRKFRQSRSNNRRTPRGQIRDAVTIAERPAQVEDRAVPGHWEGDLIKGTNNSFIATLVERQSRYVVLVKIRDYHTIKVVNALARKMKRLPGSLRQSLTWDRGVELSAHARFTMSVAMAVYFCDPRSPWQRGSNENTNGLLRQYFPKGTDLSLHNQRRLNSVAAEMNNRPRKTLGYDTPARILNEVLQ